MEESEGDWLFSLITRVLWLSLHIWHVPQQTLLGLQHLPSGLCNDVVGRGELANAVTRCGGFSAVARHLSLPVTETRGRKRATA